MMAGKLDQRITIQTYTTTRGASGDEIPSWTTFATIWANIQTTSGNEQFYSPQLTAEATHKIKLRYLSGVTPAMRISWGSKTLDITYIDESRKRQGELYILAKEKVST